MHVCRATVYSRTPCEDSVLFSIGILYLLYLQMSKYGSIFCATKDKDSKHSDHILHRSSNRDERNNSKQLLIYVRVCVFVFNVPQCMYNSVLGFFNQGLFTRFVKTRSKGSTALVTWPAILFYLTRHRKKIIHSFLL